MAPSRELYKRTSAEVIRSLGHVLWTDSRCSLGVVYFSLLDIFIKYINYYKSYHSAIVTFLASWTTTDYCGLMRITATTSILMASSSTTPNKELSTCASRGHVLRS